MNITPIIPVPIYHHSHTNIDGETLISLAVVINIMAIIIFLCKYIAYRLKYRGNQDYKPGFWSYFFDDDCEIGFLNFFFTMLIVGSASFLDFMILIVLCVHMVKYMMF